MAPERGVDPHGGSDEEGEERGDERQLEGRGEPLGHELPHWPTVLVGEPELAGRGVSDEAGELEDERVVEAEALAELFTLFEGRVLADQVVDRIADVAE